MFHISRPVSFLFAICLSILGAYGQISNDAEVERYSQEAQRALAEARYADAEHAFEKLRSLEPNVPEIYANLGLVYFQERKFEPAVSSLRHALKLKPGLPKLDTLLAMSLSELGQYKEALPGLEKGFHRSTDIAVKRMCGLQLERAYTWLHDDSKAVEVALELERQFPNDPEVLYNNGKILGNFAFLSIQKLAKVAPNSVWRHQAAAEAHESQASYVKAIDEYQRVLALEPQRPGIHYRLGRTLLARSKETSSVEDRNQASQEFQKELQLDSSNANAAYELAEMHRKAGDFGAARKLFEQALAHYPTFEHAQVGLARTLIALGAAAEALPHLQSVIARNPDSEVAYYQLAQAFKTLGNSAEQEKALAQFNRVHAIATEHRAAVPPAKTDVTPQIVDPKDPK